jgi:hypothetical protein
VSLSVTLTSCILAFKTVNIMAGLFYLYELRDRVKIAVILADLLQKTIRRFIELQKDVQGR